MSTYFIILTFEIVIKFVTKNRGDREEFAFFWSLFSASGLAEVKFVTISRNYFWGIKGFGVCVCVGTNTSRKSRDK